MLAILVMVTEQVLLGRGRRRAAMKLTVMPWRMPRWLKTHLLMVGSNWVSIIANYHQCVCQML